jgi:replication factor C subunit 1
MDQVVESSGNDIR